MISDRRKYSLVVSFDGEIAEAILFCVDKKKVTFVKKADSPLFSVEEVLSGTEPLDGFGIDLAWKRAASSIKEAILQVVEGNKKTLKQVTRVVVEVSPSIIKSGVFSYSLMRDEFKKITKEEKRGIDQAVFYNLAKDAQRYFSEETGISPFDFELSGIKIISTKINGYAIYDILGQKAQKIDFKAMVSVIPCYYREKIESMFSEVEPSLKESLVIIGPLETTKILAELTEESGIFLDIEREWTSFAIFKGERMEATGYLFFGEREFSRAIAEHLGIRLFEARAIREEYFERKLSEPARARIREFIFPVVKKWFDGLFEKVKQVSLDASLSNKVFLQGEDYLPETEELISNLEKIDLLKLKKILESKGFAFDDSLGKIKQVKHLLLCLYE